jgi:hypothetical protein
MISAPIPGGELLREGVVAAAVAAAGASGLVDRDQ